MMGLKHYRGGCEHPPTGKVREFPSGATKSSKEGKLNYAKALSPRVLKRFLQYMDKHRKQENDETRDWDNWKKGIPLDAYMESMFRHFFDVWCNHQGEFKAVTPDIEEALCALLFNVMGYLHEELKGPKPKTDFRDTLHYRMLLRGIGLCT